MPKKKNEPVAMVFDGAKVRTTRIELGMTLQDLADKTGVFPSAVSRWESGMLAPNKKRVKAIAKALRLSIKNLYIQ